ncbi:hypothetical protein BJ875DRAFT_386924 [Amylocarpus encephaloides]|uniref:CUE domain-containing protein n=1 Tax=Amylocarpus encephaloides TaxID=45428 RepID=A0A9P7YAU7_9HELO|nr:hypothetical protein BJ875DRAFT_386924 [Amylocarpus encephaloides]
MASKVSALPPLAPFPEAAWRNHLVPTEWEACLDAWISIIGAHLSRSISDFTRLSIRDESLPVFLVSYASESSASEANGPSNETAKAQLLRRQCLLLSYKLLDHTPPPESLLQWTLLADISKVYGRKQAGKILSMIFKKHSDRLELRLGALKASLNKELDAGLKGDLKKAELQLKTLNHLLHASPDTAAFFMAGSDFLDSLISCYKIMNPPLRKVIISTTYLCLVGLTEDEKPRISSLIDQLYFLEAAAQEHKIGPTNANDSLVAELVTVTPILKQAQQRIAASGSGSGRASTVLGNLGRFKKAGGVQRQPRRLKKRTDKGKSRANGASDGEYGEESNGHIHVHRMSLISQVRDLFPDLGSGFVMRLLDEYNDNLEEVISHLLEDSLPAQLAQADRSEALQPPSQPSGDLIPNLALRSTSPEMPSRKNIFDDDEFDRLAISTNKLHFGKSNHNKTAEDVLEDKTNAPNEAAILAALATFDSDDDERDDSYDVEDVGGTVDSTAPRNDPEEVTVIDGQDEVLFKAYKSTPDVFARDAATRRGKPRTALKEQTGMGDEAIEGWGLMLSRDPRQMRRLEAKFSQFGGEQRELKPTSWRGTPGGSATEDADVDNINNRGRGGRLSGATGRGRGRGNVAGPSGEQETKNARRAKEQNKGSRVRNQRAKKMARGGLAGLN